MTTTPINLFMAATLSTIEEIGAVIISREHFTEEMKTHIENCKYKHEDFGDTDVIITDPNHPDFAE